MVGVDDFIKRAATILPGRVCRLLPATTNDGVELPEPVFPFGLPGEVIPVREVDTGNGDAGSGRTLGCLFVESVGSCTSGAS